MRARGAYGLISGVPQPDSADQGQERRWSVWAVWERTSGLSWAGTGRGVVVRVILRAEERRGWWWERPFVWWPLVVVVGLSAREVSAWCLMPALVRALVSSRVGEGGETGEISPGAILL